MNKLPIIIDTDPGIDDAMMLTLAFSSEKLDVKLVTTCSGNISQDKTNYNARSLLTYLGVDVEIARGLENPMFKKLVVAEEVHGETGFANVTFGEPTIPVSKRPAIKAMYETIMESPEPITIIATGPLTNVGALLLAHPEVKANIKEISWMGGAAVGGNVTPTAEFNAYVDPHAAHIVFQSGVPIIMSGLDVTHKAYVTPQEAERILNLGTDLGTKVHSMLTYYLNNLKPSPFHEPHYAEVSRLHDLCAAMYLIHPEFFEGQHCYVEVELEGRATSGTTVVDYENKTGKEPNVNVLHTVDREAFFEAFYEAIKKMGK